MALPIRLTCDCGETHEAELGGVVHCGCGRVYPLEAPAHAQAAMMRARGGLRAAQRAGLLVIPACGMLGLVLTGSLWGFLAGPAAAIIWYGGILRLLRRRYAAAMGAVRWQAEGR